MTVLLWINTLLTSDCIPMCCNASISRIGRIYARMACVVEVIRLCLQNGKEKSFLKTTPARYFCPVYRFEIGSNYCRFHLDLPEANPWADSSYRLGIWWLRESGRPEQQVPCSLGWRWMIIRLLYIILHQHNEILDRASVITRFCASCGMGPRNPRGWRKKEQQAWRSNCCKGY